MNPKFNFPLRVCVSWARCWLALERRRSSFRDWLTSSWFFFAWLCFSAVAWKQVGVYLDLFSLRTNPATKINACYYKPFFLFRELRVDKRSKRTWLSTYGRRISLFNSRNWKESSHSVVALEYKDIYSWNSARIFLTENSCGFSMCIKRKKIACSSLNLFCSDAHAIVDWIIK